MVIQAILAVCLCGWDNLPAVDVGSVTAREEVWNFLHHNFVGMQRCADGEIHGMPPFLSKIKTADSVIQEITPAKIGCIGYVFRSIEQ